MISRQDIKFQMIVLVVMIVVRVVSAINLHPIKVALLQIEEGMTNHPDLRAAIIITKRVHVITVEEAVQKPAHIQEGVARVIIRREIVKEANLVAKERCLQNLQGSKVYFLIRNNKKDTQSSRRDNIRLIEVNRFSMGMIR